VVEKSDHFDEKKKRILDAASELFVHFGFKKTTLEDIARRAGMRKPTLYYYFKSKEDIFSTFVRMTAEESSDRIRAAVKKEKDLRGKISAFVKTRYQIMREKKSFYSVKDDILTELSPMALKEAEAYFQVTVDILADILKYGNEHYDLEIESPELVAMVAVAGLGGIDQAFLQYANEDMLEKGMDILLELIFRNFD